MPERASIAGIDPASLIAFDPEAGTVKVLGPKSKHAFSGYWYAVDVMAVNGPGAAATWRFDIYFG